MGRLRVLAAIAAGGAIGSVSRYGLAAALPHHPTRFPWATFITNAAGCFAIGLLMVVVAERLSGRPLLRPFLGVGVLGGFTTFSTYALEIQRMVDAGAAATAAVYLAGTVVAALAAAYAGSRLMRFALMRRDRLALVRQDRLAPVHQDSLAVIDRVEEIRYVGRDR